MLSTQNLYITHMVIYTIIFLYKLHSQLGRMVTDMYVHYCYGTGGLSCEVWAGGCDRERIKPADESRRL